MSPINCTAKYFKDCLSESPNLNYQKFPIRFPLLLYQLQIPIPLIGTILNGISLFIFARHSSTMSSKFLKFLKYSIINSLTITTLHLFLFTATAYFLQQLLRYDTTQFSPYSYTFSVCYGYVFIPVWNVSYTIGSLLDIVIAYERILLYLPKLQFLRNTNLYTYLLFIFVLSVLINTPSILSREITSTPVIINATFNVTYYQVVKKDYRDYEQYFAIVHYVFNALRDVLTLFVELLVSVFFILTIIKFHERKRRVQLASGSDAKQKRSKSHKIDLNNSKIVLYICFVSTVNRIGSILMLISFYFLAPAVNSGITLAFGYIFLVRYCLNFFILLKLNKKFQEHFVGLVPRCLRPNEKGPTNHANNMR